MFYLRVLVLHILHFHMKTATKCMVVMRDWGDCLWRWITSHFVWAPFLTATAPYMETRYTCSFRLFFPASLSPMLGSDWVYIFEFYQNSCCSSLMFLLMEVVVKTDLYSKEPVQHECRDACQNDVVWLSSSIVSDERHRVCPGLVTGGQRRVYVQACNHVFTDPTWRAIRL